MRKLDFKRIFKNFLFFCFCLSALSLTSCSEEPGEEGRDYEGRPEDIVDDDHVKVENRYGIIAICEKGTWGNQYCDTMPEASRDYYKDYLYNQVALSYKPDTLMGGVSSATAVYLMRFFKQTDSVEVAMKFMEDYRDDVFCAFEGLYYSEITPLESTKLNGYDAYRFTVKMSEDLVKDGVQEYYLMYHKKRIYCAGYSISASSSENAKEICEEVLNTVKLGQ